MMVCFLDLQSFSTHCLNFQLPCAFINIYEIKNPYACAYNNKTKIVKISNSTSETAVTAVSIGFQNQKYHVKEIVIS